MKKILSFILCINFLNMMLCPAVLADDVQAWKGEQFDTYLAPALRGNMATQNSADSVQASTNSAQSTADTTVQNSTNTEQNTANTAVSNTADSSNQTAATVSNQAQTAVSNQNQNINVVQQPDTQKTEHLAIRKNNSKKINVESVYITSHNVEIPANDILQVAFVNDFNGRKARVGDSVEFRFPNDIVTQEGTVIIPSTTRIIAEITKLKKPKPLHLSGKVYLEFKYLQFIDGTTRPIEARIYGKKDFLSRKTLNKSAAVGETAVTTGAGAVTGAVICAETATNAAVVIFGTAISAGVGAIAGVAVGILLPGASFKAKAGQRVNIELTQELDI